MNWLSLQLIILILFSSDTWYQRRQLAAMRREAELQFSKYENNLNNEFGYGASCFVQRLIEVPLDRLHLYR